MQLGGELEAVVLGRAFGGELAFGALHLRRAGQRPGQGLPLAGGVEAQFRELHIALDVQRQWPVGGGQSQLVQFERMRVAGGGEAHGRRAEFGHGGVDFARSPKAGQHALGGEPDGQRFAGQVGGERLEVRYIQFGLDRPRRFGQRLAHVAIQFQRGRAGDFVAQLQPVAQFALDFAPTLEGAVVRGR